MIQTKPKKVHFDSADDTLHLICISDVHHAQDSSNEKLLIHDLQESRKFKHRLYIGIGDELDSIARGDKRHKMEDLKDRFTRKDTYPRLIDAEVEDYARILGQYTQPEEWLGHISGNHPLVMTETQIDPTQRLCAILGHPYLGYSAFVPITFTVGKQNTVTGMMVMAHHGFGGTNARKEGGGLNSYIDHALRYEGWDLALYGHRHDRWSKTVPRIHPQSLGGNSVKPAWVRAIDRKVCQCGTYMRTLARGIYPTYSEKAGYPPRPIGALVLEIGLDRSGGRNYDRKTVRFLGSNE